jgi:phage baseplate assembly protein W
MIESDALIGHGLAFPLRVDARGGIALARGEQEINEAIRIILGTAPGQRVMRPEFGCRIHELLFAPIDASTAGMVIHYVKEALGRWEPRIDVLRVDVDVDHDDGRIDIEIHYRIRSTHDERALVYPFYIIPGEE